MTVEMAGALEYPEAGVNVDAERDWIRSIRGGDPQTYRLLVERYQSRIYRLVARLLGPGHRDIEDVVQEVFVKAYFSLNRFREESSFGTWITRIAINRARDELRKQSKGRVSLDGELSQESLQMLRDYCSQLDSDEKNRSPSEAISQLVGRAVASLPEHLRVVVSFKDMEGLSYQEVSQVLNCSVGTVKSRHARARERLRKFLSPNFSDFVRR